MKKIAVIIFLLLFSFTASADSCGNLSSSITLTHDMTSAGTCFVIKADNITIDCSGYWINYSQSEKGYGIHSDGYDNVNIKNCRFNNSVFSPSHAILLTDSLNSIIANITAEFQSSESYGIFLNSSDYTNITDTRVISQYADSYGVMMKTSENNYIRGLNITTLGDSTYGIYLSSSSKNHISESFINTSGDYSHGIYLYLNSFNNSLSEVNVTTSGDNAYAMKFEFSDNNTIIKSNVKTAGNSSYGMYIFYSDNNQFSEAEIDTNSYGLMHIGSVNNIMENSSIYSADSILSNSQSNNTIINTTFSKSGSSVVNNSYLYVKWFFDVHVKNGLGQNVSDANVTINDKNNNTVFSELTDNQGNIPGKKLLEYIKNSTGEYYFSNYTLSAVKYDSNGEQKFNLTESLFFDIFLDLSMCKQLYLNYSLVNEVTAEGTCFEVMADNVRLNCNNFPVYYSSSSPGYGILSGFNNTIIENCNFIHNNSGITNAYGIFLNKSSYGKIINSTVAVNSSRGIYLINSSFNNLSATVESNSSFFGIYLDRSHSNNLTVVLKGASKKLGLNRSSNNLIKDSIFYDDNQTFSWNSDNTFLNNSFNSSKIYISNSNLTVKWYADLFVNDTDGNNASGVNITLWDKDNIEIFKFQVIDCISGQINCAKSNNLIFIFQ